MRAVFHALLASAKKILLYCTNAAATKFNNDFTEQQEVAGALAEIVIELLALESAILRTEKMEAKADSLPVILTRYYAAARLQHR